MLGRHTAGTSGIELERLGLKVGAFDVELGEHGVGGGVVVLKLPITLC